MPTLLGIREPPFIRRLPGLIESRMAALGLQCVDILTLWVNDVMELKHGGAIQVLFDLRARGLCDHIGLAHPDVRDLEWLALHTAVRVLVVPYSLEDQSARYRLFAAAQDSGMVCLASDPTPGARASSPADSGPSLQPAAYRLPPSLSFSLAESARALPILSQPIPDDLAPMSPNQIERAWELYQRTHAEPAPLPRGGPPGE
jgi:aryl-alcohol dehydrogenase-like predicted oxidoreductase